MLPADSPFAPLPAPGPHPDPAELRAYAAGTLAPAAEHRIEAHTLDCERCADLLDGFSMTDAATTDNAIAELRVRLQARLGTEKPAPAAVGWAWPRIAAVAAMLSVVAGGIWSWEKTETTTYSAPATARLETSAPPAPTQAAPPPPASRAAEVAMAPPPPAQARHPEYAAAPAMPPASAPTAMMRSAPLRPPARLGRTAPGLTSRAAATEQESMEVAAVTTADAQVAAPTAASGAVLTEADGWGKHEAPAAKKSLPDSTTMNTADKVASNFALAAPKAKSAVVANNAAAARVLNTPMPAGYAINPAPVMGKSALRDYINREVNDFEPDDDAPRLSGSIRLKFTVEANGQLSNLKIVRGLRADYDEEALRIVCEGPAWQPGIAGGKRAPLPVELTILF